MKKKKGCILKKDIKRENFEQICDVIAEKRWPRD